MNIRARHDAIVRSLRRTGMATVDELAAEVGGSRPSSWCNFLDGLRA
jgi:DeoR/GlpR family transcriptional regulator of sugar metabolism